MKYFRTYFPLLALFMLSALPVYSQVNLPPVGQPEALTVTEDIRTSFRLFSRDPEGDPITYSIATNPKFGAVIALVPGRLSPPPTPTLSPPVWEAVFEYKPYLNFNGKDVFTYTVSDGTSTSAPITVNLDVTPVDDKPIANVGIYGTTENTSVNGQLAAHDVETPVLSLNYVKLSGPTNGVLNLTGNTFTYTPNRGARGSDFFRFEASDGVNSSTPASPALPTMIFLTIKPVNQIPVGNLLTVSTMQEKEFVGTLTATDLDAADKITYRLGTAASKGTVSIAGDGKFTYTPKPNENGSDTFTYIANDGVSDSLPATVTMTITLSAPVNHAPVGVEVRVITTENQTSSGQLSATDPDGGILSFRLGKPARRGVVSISQAGHYDYVPNSHFNGYDSFTFFARDLLGLNSVETTVFVTVTAINDPPTAIPMTLTLPPSKKLIGQLQGVDIDGDSLTYQKSSGPSTVAVSPDGRFTYEGGLDSDSFSYTVSDGQVTSAPVAVTLKVSADAVGIIGDILNHQVTVANFLSGSNNPQFSQVSLPGTGPIAALDQAVDRANRRLYVLTAGALQIYDIESAPPTNTTLAYRESVDIVGTRLVLSLDGRTAYIGSTGKVTAINLYKESVYEGGDAATPGNSVEKAAYQYRREFPFTKDPSELIKREVAAMGMHPSGDRLFVVVDMKESDKKLNINNDLLRSDVGNGQRAGTVTLPTDFGYITQLDVSADVQTAGVKRALPKLAQPVDIKNLINTTNKAVVIGIKSLAFSPDGNCALLTAVGAQTARATAFGIMPTSDEGTGGIVVLDVRPRASNEPWVQYLGFIPTTERGEKTAELRNEIQRQGWKIIHPDVQWARNRYMVAQGITDLLTSNSITDGSLASQTWMTNLTVASDALGILEVSFKDYGYMEAYSKLYPHDMVGASSVAINHAGDFGVVTMQDTNNLGLLSLTPSNILSGYNATNLPDFFIKTGTGKAINKLQSEGTATSWAYPQKVAFTSDDSRIFIGMAGGTPKADLSNKFGSADAFKLRTEWNRPVPNTNRDPGYSMYGGSPLALKSPRLAATNPGFASDQDMLSDQLKAYNRWNSLLEIPIEQKAALVSTDATRLVIPGKQVNFASNTPDALDLGYLLPPSGVGYRLNTFGQPIKTTSFATKGVVTSLEQLGLEWDKRYREYQRTNVRDPLIPITRPYFIAGLLSQPGGGKITNLQGEALAYKSGTGLEADFTYFTINSDTAYDLIISNGPTSPTNNTGERKIGFDVENTTALIRLLLAQSRVKKIELDPYVLEIINLPEITTDPRIVPHGSRTIKNSRRDMDNHMLVTFGRMSVALHIDSDNNGVLDRSPEEDALSHQEDAIGKTVWANNQDLDGDGIPNYADGYDKFSGEGTPNAGGLFTPMVISLPDDISLVPMKFSLTYSESDPSLVLRSGTAPNYTYAPQPGGGAFRVWTKDGGEARKMAEIDAAAGGDFIKSGKEYSIASLHPGTNREVTLYIESVGALRTNEKGNVVFKLILNAGPQIKLQTLTDTVRVTPAAFTVTQNGGPLPMAKYKREYDPKRSDFLGALNLAVKVGSGTVELKLDSGADKVSFFESAAVGAVVSTLKWPADKVPSVLYVQGNKVSATPLDIKLKLVYTPTDGVVLNSEPLSTTVFDIKQVEWVESYAKQLEPQPLGTPGGGLRIFPHKQITVDPTTKAIVADPATVNRKLVHIRCTIEPAIKDVNIFFKIVDVDDPSASTAPIDDPSPFSLNARQDNIRAPEYPTTFTPPIQPALGTPTDINGQASIDFEATMRPGDNFRTVACLAKDLLSDLGAIVEDGDKSRIEIMATNTPIEDVWTKSTSPYAVSPLLTVWRKLYVEVDSMGDVVENALTVDITSVGVLSGNHWAQTSQSLSVDSLDRYEGGKLMTIGNVFVANVFGSTDFILHLDRAVAVGQYKLVDDDLTKQVDGTTPLKVSVPDTSHIKTAFAPAYVEPDFDTYAPLTDSNIVFQLNIDAPSESLRAAALVGFIRANRGSPEINNDVWSAYLVGVFQGPKSKDNDPSSEDALGGDTPHYTALNYAEGCVLYLETQRDYRFDHKMITTHELGHFFNGVGVDGIGHEGDDSLMGDGGHANSGAFSAATIDKIRKWKRN